MPKDHPAPKARHGGLGAFDGMFDSAMTPGLKNRRFAGHWGPSIAEPLPKRLEFATFLGIGM